MSFWRNSHVFVTEGDDFGYTDIVQHEIYLTGSCLPAIQADPTHTIQGGQRPHKEAVKEGCDPISPFTPKPVYIPSLNSGPIAAFTPKITAVQDQYICVGAHFSGPERLLGQSWGRVMSAGRVLRPLWRNRVHCYSCVYL